MNYQLFIIFLFLIFLLLFIYFQFQSSTLSPPDNLSSIKLNDKGFLYLNDRENSLKFEQKSGEIILVDKKDLNKQLFSIKDNKLMTSEKVGLAVITEKNNEQIISLNHKNFILIEGDHLIYRDQNDNKFYVILEKFLDMEGKEKEKLILSPYPPILPIFTMNLN